MHGPPLAHGSCSPSAPSSAQLTVGTPDANGAAASSVGFAQLAVVSGNPSTAADEADVQMKLEIGDVRNVSDLSDYGGELEARTTIRVTDRASGPATLEPVALPVAMPCSTTVSEAIGATCALSTTFDALMPGVVDEGARALWELARIELLDSGPDGDVATPDNTLFATPGIFVP
jgi:hypothetical protein